MLLNDMLNSWKNTRSYASKDHLLKVVEKAGFPTNGMLVVKIPGTDRFTAVFAKSTLDANFIHVAQFGFKVLG